MNNKQFKVAVTRQLPEPVETRMKELFDVNLSNSPHPLTSCLLYTSPSPRD